MKPGRHELIRITLDQQIPAMQYARTTLRRPEKGWLRAVREALGVQQTKVAKAIGVKRQSYTQLEQAEANRTITLKSLDRAAEAMDCEVVYFLVPKATAGRTYEELAQIHDPLLQLPRETEHSMPVEGHAVGDQTLPLTLR